MHGPLTSAAAEMRSSTFDRPVSSFVGRAGSMRLAFWFHLTEEVLKQT